MVIRLCGSGSACASVVLAAVLTACGAKSSHACDPTPVNQSAAGAGVQDPASTNAGLAFTAVDPGYTASSLLLNNPASGQLSVLDTGESGDPFLSWLGDRLYLFNRKAGNLNFRSFLLRDPAPTKTCQLATPAAGVGDPHDALLLSPRRLLLAQNAAGQLVVVDPFSGELLQTVSAAWDLGLAGAPLRPEKFYVRDAGDGTRLIYVLHQGLDANSTPNGTQRVLVLKDDGVTVTVADAHGFPLKVNNPLGFFPAATPASVLIYGECFSKTGCTQGFEELTFATGTTALVFDTGALGLLGNGGLVAGTGGAFYELAVNAAGKRVVEKLSPAAKAAQDVYAFAGPSGCCALYFDTSSGTLYAGDTDAKGQQGFLAVQQAGATTATQVPLPELAYGGVFVPR